MGLMTVKEYSEAYKVSPQSVYQRIKSGSLKVEIKDNIKYIVSPDASELQVSYKDDHKEVAKLYKAIIKGLKKDIKKAEKKQAEEIQRITSDKDKQYQHLEDMFNKVLKLCHGINASNEVTEVKAIEVKSKKKKKKKK